MGPMVNLTVTSATAAGAAIALFLLAIPISFRRIATGTMTGAGDDAQLNRLIRIHGNFTEYVPTALIAMALAENLGASRAMMLVIAGSLVVGRGLHIISMFTGNRVLRVLGMIGTHNALLVSAAQIILALLH